MQKCDLKFGSWTHNGWLLDLQMIDVDVSTYIPNGEWDLVGKKKKKTGANSDIIWFGLVWFGLGQRNLLSNKMNHNESAGTF